MKRYGDKGKRAEGISFSLSWLLRAAVVAILIHQAVRLSDPAVLGTTDYVEYWSAGRLNARGQNPYSAELLFPLQQPYGCPDDRPIMMYNPPWTLPFIMPLGLLDFGLSRLIWLLLNLAVVLLCSAILWRLYGGSPRRQWIALLAGLCFFPTLIVLRMGQIGPLVLLGLVGFLWALRRRSDRWAGAMTVLTAIKPHLVFLFWIVLLLWAWDRRRWYVLAGAALSGLTAIAIALACNPHVMGQYADVMAHNPPSQCLSPSLGSVLRIVFGLDRFGLQFVPPVLGLVWLVPYWMHHRRHWDWNERMPMLLLVSVLTTAYGAWAFDLVVLLPAVMQAAVVVCQAGRSRWAAGGAGVYLALNGLALAMGLGGVDGFWFIWLTPVLLLGYVIVRWQQVGSVSPRSMLLPGLTPPAQQPQSP